MNEQWYLFVALVLLFVSGVSIGWGLRGCYEDRRKSKPTITLFEQPQTKQDSSKL